jgi:hypothetical protein
MYGAFQQANSLGSITGQSVGTVFPASEGPDEINAALPWTSGGTGGGGGV